MPFPIHYFLKKIGRKESVSQTSQATFSHAVTLETKSPVSVIFASLIHSLNVSRTISAARCRWVHSVGKTYRKSAVIAVLFGFTVQPNCAWAQYSPDASMDLGIGFGQMALGQAAISGTRRIGIESARAFQDDTKDTTEPTVSVTGSLSFKSTPSVTQVVNHRFAAWQSEDHPEMLAEIEGEIASGALQAYFGDVLNQYRLESNNLADVTAAYYISLWRIIHGRDPTSRQVLGVRDQLRTFMAEDAELMRLPDAEKQEISETFILHSAVALQGYEQLLETKDTQTLALFREWVQANLAPQGPEILALEISDHGFVTGR